MSDSMIISVNEDGVAKVYDPEWDITIHCESEEDHKRCVKILQEALERRWIPVSKRLPEDDRFVLLSFENFTIPMIGRYEEDEDGNGNWYLGDCDEQDTCLANDLYVNAWMPLPEPYREEELYEIHN